jgi:CDP-paratose 2-epimerase
MKILITGACGFVGSCVCRHLTEAMASARVIGVDNFARPGSELNRSRLRSISVDVRHADIRCASDVEELPPVDWVIDAAANPSVLAGINGTTSSRQLIENNLIGTINLLEYCKRNASGFILISTSRVYSILGLTSLPTESSDGAFRLRSCDPLPDGVSLRGLSEQFSTAAPLSLYGSAKLASEILATEYSETFGFPARIDRCGVIAGAGQFGRVDQGIFAYWINSWLRRRPLKYVGFGGSGYQVRDCLHPRDLAALVLRQITRIDASMPRTVNVGGGLGHAMSLAQLSEWCRVELGPHAVACEVTTRPFDIPWLIMDASAAAAHWNWMPTTPLNAILSEIAAHGRDHPEWLELSMAN